MRRQEEEKRVKDVTKQLKGVEVNNNGESMMDVEGMATPRIRLLAYVRGARKGKQTTQRSGEE